MTRGQIAIIFKGYGEKENSLMTSTEFNGDMYMPTKKWAGHGRTVINALKRVKDVANYQYEVAKFNNNNHHYNDERLTYLRNPTETVDMLDFTNNYFENWFSDYVYIKNITKEDVTIKTTLYDDAGEDYGSKDVVLKPNAIAVLCFGKLEKLVEEQ